MLYASTPAGFTSLSAQDAVNADTKQRVRSIVRSFCVSSLQPPDFVNHNRFTRPAMPSNQSMPIARTLSRRRAKEASAIASAFFSRPAASVKSMLHLGLVIAAGAGALSLKVVQTAGIATGVPLVTPAWQRRES